MVVDADGVPLGAVSAPAKVHDLPLLGPTLKRFDELGPLPEKVTVHLDRGYHSTKTRKLLADRGLHGQIAERGKPAPIQAGQRWPVERTNAWVNAFNRLQRCYECRQIVIDAFLSLAHAIITLRRTPTPSLESLPLGLPTSPPPLKIDLSARALRQARPPQVTSWTGEIGVPRLARTRVHRFPGCWPL